MNEPRKILILHDPGPTPEEVPALVGALEALGGVAVVRPCCEPYGEVLDAVAEADTVVYWR